MAFKNQETSRAYHTKYYALVREERRKQRVDQKLQALSLYGPQGRIQCSWPGCEVSDPDVLTLDHVDNDGYARRAAGESRGDSLYRKVLKEPLPGLQTLCANHNLKKEVLRRRDL